MYREGGNIMQIYVFKIYIINSVKKDSVQYSFNDTNSARREMSVIRVDDDS